MNEVQRPSAHRRGWTQLLVLMALILPGLGSPALSIESMHFIDLAAAVMARDLGLLALVLYFVWSEGERWDAVGWRRSNVAREAVIGALLFLPVVVFVGVLQVLLQKAGLPPARAPSFLIPTGWVESAIAVPLLAVVAVTEETLFRGFVLGRLASLTQRRDLAVACSSVLFAVGHGYQGFTAVVTVAALGVVLSMVYLWRGSLVAPVTLHLLQNLAGMFLAPHL